MSSQRIVPSPSAVRPSLLRTALFIALGTAAGSAFAGDVCDTADGNAAAENRNFSTAPGSDQAFACGFSARAAGAQSTAFGRFTHASGAGALVSGTGTAAKGTGATALGGWYDIDGNGLLLGNSFLPGNSTRQLDEFGEEIWLSEEGTYAFGAGATALGAAAHSVGREATAVGARSVASAERATAIGTQNEALAFGSTAIGNANKIEAFATGSVAVGNENRIDASAAAGTAVGYSNRVANIGSTAVGTNNIAYGYAFGRENAVNGIHSTGVGYNNLIGGEFNVALGSKVRIGTRAYDISGNPLVDANGAPVYLTTADHVIALSSSGFDDDPTNVGAGADNAIAIGRATQVTAGAVDAIAIGRAANVTVAGAVAIGAGSQGDRAGAVSFGAAGAERQLTHVAAGTQATDATNLAQLNATLATANAYTDTVVSTGSTATTAYTDNREAAIRADTTAADDGLRAEAQAGDAETLTAANQYTDSRIGSLGDINGQMDSLRKDVDYKFARTDRRIDRVGAMGSAMLNMAINAAGSNNSRGRMAVGVGGQGGSTAVSIGYGRRVGRSASFSVGGSVSGGESSLGAGFGWDL